MYKNSIRISYFFIFVLFLLNIQRSTEATTPGGTAESNLIVNGDFEQGAGTDGLPKGWRKKGDEIEISLVSEAKAGNYACRLSMSAIKGCRGIQQKLVVIPGEAYVLRFAYKLEDITSKTRESFSVLLQYTGGKAQWLSLGLVGEGKSKDWSY